MRFRKLRIAFSVTCGIACVLLIVLWVRSSGRVEVIRRENRPVLYDGVYSSHGFVVIHGEPDLWLRLGFTGWKYERLPSDFWKPKSHWRPYFLHQRKKMELLVPYWIVAFVTIMAGAAPWLPWRFSLCTLLIATTLVAVVLGLIVWLR